MQRDRISARRRAAALACACLAPLTAGAVDGVVLITQARALAGGITADDTPGYPITLSEPGSYRLASNLLVTPSDTPAIVITAPGVTLDLNGFTITGPGRSSGTVCHYGNPGNPVTASACGITSDFVNSGGSVVMNGTVRDFGGTGIALDAGSTVQHVLSLNNGGEGVFISSGARIHDSEANNNASHGFHIRIGQITGVNATANGGDGILIDFGHALVLRSISERNTGFGLSGGSASAVTGYAENAFAGNTAGQVTGALLSLGPNACNAALCP